MLRRGHRSGAATPAAVLVVLSALAAGCSSGGDSTGAGDLPPASTTMAASPSAGTTTASTTPLATTTGTASPTPSGPLSRFEGDPAVKAFREFSLQSALAVNARNLGLPALAAVSTPARQARNRVTLQSDVGSYVPGPYPSLPLGVRTVSATTKKISLCLMASGWIRTRKGGPARNDPSSVGAVATVVRVAGVWKVDTVYTESAISCMGVTIPMPTFA